MKRSISTFGLLLTSVSAIVGSGWLFSAYYTASIAGPAAILSWVIGGISLVIVAFVFAEICGMLPVTASSTRIPQYTHGTIVSFMFAWMIWLSYLALMAAEVQAVIQYSSFYLPGLVKPTGGLTHHGYWAAFVLMFAVSLINTYSLRWLIRCNSLLTLVKITIPIVLVAFILFHFASPTHILHPGNSSFMPMGMKGVLGAISSGGIVFAFNGFKQAAEMAGDAKNPGRSVPMAIVGSVLLCLTLFLLIQFSFFSSLDLGNIVQGWTHLSLSDDNSPLASILKQDHLGFLLPLLYVGAIIAPLAAGLMYCSSAARSLYGMSKNGYLPSVFQTLSRQGNPMISVVINFFFGMCLFAPLPGWNSIVAFLTSLLALTYAVGPVCLIALRSQAPLQPRPLRLPFPRIWSFVAFYVCTLLAYWSGWAVLSKMGVALLIGLLFVIVYRLFSSNTLRLNVKESLWMWPYFAGLMVISYFGNYGGTGALTVTSSFFTIALFCLVILCLSYLVRLPAAETKAYIKALHLECDDDRL